MLLLVGLGNPGPEYARNRHNIGFLAIDRIVDQYRFGPFRGRFQGLAAEGRLDGAKVLALKPLTFVNESGRAVGAAARFYKLDPADVVVLHDELDLVAGKLRVKCGGGLAGHNGLRSIAAHIGDDFRRVRLGIGHPGEKHKVLKHVLGDFAKADHGWLGKFLDAVADAAPHLAGGDDPGFATQVALILKPPNAKPKAADRMAAVPAANSDDGGGDGL